MVNHNLQQQAEEDGKPFIKQALVFQPVEVSQPTHPPTHVLMLFVGV
jgi:hypothetical protein